MDPGPPHEGCLDLARLDGLAAGASDASASAHLQTCKRCQSLLAEMRSANRFLLRFQSREGTESPRTADPESIQVDGYMIQSVVAFGGQGAVYKAIQAGTGRTVAIKVPLADTQSRPSSRYRFEREIELTARLDHPAIVRVIGPCELADGRIGCVMEFIEGERFDHWAQARRDSDRDAVRGIVEAGVRVADAIAYAHQRAVLHRDIKPSNVIVSAEGEPHVLDFGLAKALGESAQSFATLTGAFVGTLSHAAPEQVSQGADAVDIRTDVYALGLLLYEALTGRLPYATDASTAEILRQIKELPTPRPSSFADNIDNDLDAVLLRALAKEKDRRYQAAGELRDDLLAWLEGRAVRARFDSQWYVLRKTIRRHRWPVMLATAGLAVVLTTVTLGLIARNQTTRAQMASAVRDARTLESHWVRLAEARSTGIDNFEAGERIAWDALLQPEQVLVDEGIEGIKLLDGTPTSAAYWALWEMYLRTPVVFSVPDTHRPLVTFAGSTKVIVSSDRTHGRLRWWDWNNATEIRSTPMPVVATATSILPSPDGQRMVFVTAEKRCLLIDLGDGSWTELNAGERSFGASITNHRVATTTQLADGLFEWRLFAIGPEGPEVLTRRTFESYNGMMCFGADGTDAAFITETGEVLVVDAESGRQLFHQTGNEKSPFFRIMTRGTPGEFVLIGTTGVATLNARNPDAGIVHASSRNAFLDGARWLAGTPNSDRYVAVSDRFRVGVGRRSEPLTQGEYLPALSGGFMVISSDGRLVCGPARPSERGIVLDLDSDAITRLPLPAPVTGRGFATVFDVVFTPDSRQLLVGAMDGSVRRFSVGTDAALVDQPVYVDGGVTALGVSDEAVYAGTHDLGLNNARIVRIDSNQTPVTIVSGERLMAALEVDPAGRFWALTGEGRLLQFDEGRQNTLKETRLPPHPDHHTFRALVRHPDRRLLVAGPAGDGVVLLDQETLEPVASVSMPPIREFAVHPTDPDLLATAGDDGMIRLWRFESDPTPTLRSIGQFGAHAGAIFTLAFSPDGRLIASGSGTPEARDVRLWDVANGRELAALDLFEMGVFELAFSPDGRWLAVGGEVRMEAPEEGGQLFLIDLEAPARCVAGNLDYHIARLTEELGHEPSQAEAMRLWAAGVRRSAGNQETPP